MLCSDWQHTFSICVKILCLSEKNFLLSPSLNLSLINYWLFFLSSLISSIFLYAFVFTQEVSFFSWIMREETPTSRHVPNTIMTLLFAIMYIILWPVARFSWLRILETNQANWKHEKDIRFQGIRRFSERTIQRGGDLYSDPIDSFQFNLVPGYDPNKVLVHL